MGLEGLQNEPQKGRQKAQRGPRGNTFKPGPGLWLVERVYHSSPRWERPDDVKPHVRPWFRKKPHSDANREPEIVAAMHTAWDTHEAHRSPALNFEQGRRTVAVCVNPFCVKRTQVFGQPNVFDLKRQHKKAGYDKPVCGECGLELSIQMVRELRNKWVYVILGDGPKARLRYEIFAEEPGRWYWLVDPKIGPRAHRDFAKIGKPASGANRIPKESQDDCIQFFVSPVQLTENALQRLMQAARVTRSEMVDQDEQQRFTTVRRYFTELAFQDKELVTVIDPFSFAEEVNHWDYEPITDTWFTFNMNQQENTKRQIAVLLNAIAEDGDPHDIVDEMNDKRDKWVGTTNARHKAQAWIEQYQACHKFLKQAHNQAGERLCNWLDCDAHAIVEIACQQEADQPGYKYLGQSTLTLGILHLASVLEHLLSCPSGAAYITRLATRQKRLAYRFILHPGEEEKKQLKIVRSEIGDVAVTLLASFVPKILHDAPLYGEAKRLARHLADHQLEVSESGQLQRRTPFGHSQLIAAADTAMSLNDAVIKVYKRGFLPETLADTTAWKLRTGLDDILKAYELFTGFKAFLQDGEYEGTWEGIKAYKKKADHVHNVANFMVAQGKLSFAWYIKKTEGFDLADLEKTTLKKGNWREIIRSGQFARYEKMIGYYRKLYTAGRVLGGPVAFILSGFDYIASPPDLLAAWERNRGEGIATALTYYGSGLAAAAALMQTIGMLASLSPGMAAAASALVNPLLLIALVLVIIGMIVFWATRQNELEKFAAHCFLGDEYGRGDHEPRPWATLPYKYWDDGRGRFQDQLRFLLNLVGSFRIQTISSFNGYVLVPGSDGQKHTITQLLYGGYVLPSYVPSGAKADCFVEGYYITGKGRKPIRTRVLVDLDSGNYVAMDQNHRKISVSAVPSGSWGTERFRGLAVQVDHILPEGYSKKDGHHHYKFGARLDLTGTGRYLPAGADNYVELENTRIKSDRSSLDVAPKPYYKKKKKKDAGETGNSAAPATPQPAAAP